MLRFLSLQHHGFTCTSRCVTAKFHSEYMRRMSQNYNAGKDARCHKITLREGAQDVTKLHCGKGRWHAQEHEKQEKRRFARVRRLEIQGQEQGLQQHALVTVHASAYNYCNGTRGITITITRRPPAALAHSSAEQAAFLHEGRGVPERFIKFKTEKRC